jgi:hypothetical protein
MDKWTDRFKNTLFVRAYTFTKIPLIWWLRPQILELGKQKTEIKIALNRRTKNHLNSMYFGSLAVGAELVIAMKAVVAIYQSKAKVDFVFKDFHADFLKRPDGDVHFICVEGEAVEALIAKALTSGVRENQQFSGYAVVPSINPEEKVMSFNLTLSVKKRSKK